MNKNTRKQHTDNDDQARGPLSSAGVRELLNQPVDEAENYFVDRVIAAGQPLSIIATSGGGATRFVFQLAFSMILGRPFLGFDTNAKGKRWLIVQAEYSNHKLATETKLICDGLGLVHDELSYLNERIVFHTLRHGGDCAITLDNPEDWKELALLIDEFSPDFVVFDPLCSFHSKSIESYANMKALCMHISQVVMRGHPKRVPIVVHRSSSGDDTRALDAWSRGQISLSWFAEYCKTATVTCRKNNNGPRFESLDVKINNDLIFEAATPRLDTILDVLGHGRVLNHDLAKLLNEQFGMPERVACRFISNAEDAGLITRTSEGRFAVYSRKNI